MKRKVYTDGNGSMAVLIDGLGHYVPVGEVAGLKRENAELKAQVERFRTRLDDILEDMQLSIELSESDCDIWKGRIKDTLSGTPAQCLAEVKAQAVDSLCPLKFASIAFRHAEKWPKDIEVDDIKLAFKFMAQEIRQQAKAGE